MADDKNGRDEQARAAENRQRERAVTTELERMDEPEPPIDAVTLEELEEELTAVAFPATGDELVERLGDRMVEAETGTYRLADLLPETDIEVFEEPAAVRERVQRPTVAATMKRVVEAATTLQNAEFPRSQRAGYEQTLQELRSIDPSDDDSGVRVIGDWIVERIHEKEKLPGSRAVRREAGTYCRKNGYEVRSDEWLGI